MTIAQRLAAVRAELPGGVRLLAVSKRHPVAAIQEAYDAGQRDFGENTAQELATKAEALAHLSDIRWHFIGRLQSNKAKQVLRYAHWLHSLDRASLWTALATRLSQRPEGMPPLRCLVQVNTAGDPAKAGFTPEDAAAFLTEREGQPLPQGLALDGFMTMPYAGGSPVEAFQCLAALSDGWTARGIGPERSMGMSGDFAEAVAAGSTLVRIGSAIFGDRPGFRPDP